MDPIEVFYEKYNSLCEICSKGMKTLSDINDLIDESPENNELRAAFAETVKFVRYFFEERLNYVVEHQEEIPQKEADYLLGRSTEELDILIGESNKVIAPIKGAGISI